jgi:hypothetical protein
MKAMLIAFRRRFTGAIKAKKTKLTPAEAIQLFDKTLCDTLIDDLESKFREARFPIIKE